MDLKEFVRDALIDVVEGIAEAQSRHLGGAVINPQMKTEIVKDEHGRKLIQLNAENLKAANLIATNYSEGFADIIEFDLAITVESSASEEKEGTKKGEGGLKIHVVSAGVDVGTRTASKTEESKSNVSRIKFRVPVQLPRR